jgi:hypothetical protein
MNKKIIIFIIIAIASSAILVYFAARPWVHHYGSIRIAATEHGIPSELYSFPHRGPVMVLYYNFFDYILIIGNCDFNRVETWIGPVSGGATFLAYPADDYLTKEYGLTPNVEMFHTEFKRGGKSITVFAQPSGRFAITVYSDMRR